jgi:glycosyltransferase involved in cell wall biosynthesis
MISEHASPLAVLGGVDAGGQNVHVAALATALGKLGHVVDVYTRRDAPSLPERVAFAPGVSVVHVDAGPARAIAKDAIWPHMRAFAQRLVRDWRVDAPDVVHAHFWMSGYAGLRAARMVRVPFVQTFHALGVEKLRHQGRADTSPAERVQIERDLARDADRIVATASAEVFELLRMGAPQRAVKIVPCGVDLEHFTPEGPREERRSGRFRIVTLSRLVPRKGIADAIAALVDVPDAELIVAGGGEGPDLVVDPEAARLSELARSLDVSDRVYLRGRVERSDVPALLRSADVVACAPWYEPFGIVPLEAMACGVPVVVSSVGGLIDTVVDGVTGVHVPPRSPQRLGAALAELAADPERRARYGRLGVERVRTRYAWSRVALETLDVYRSIAADEPSLPTVADL